MLFADENENDDINSSFVDPPSSHQPQPMELDEDEEDTNQSAASSQHPPQSSQQQQQATSQMPEVASRRGHRHRFFQRSESTLCVGCPPPDPFETPLFDALPLAEQPQLLQPNARREDLFGTPRQPLAPVAEVKPSNPLFLLPTR